MATPQYNTPPVVKPVPVYWPAQGTILPHLLLPAVQILAFALPPFRYRAAVFVPIICALVVLTWYNLFTDALDIRVFLIAQWPWYLNSIERLCFTNPEQDFWRDGRPKEALNMGFLSKLHWSAAMYTNPRGVGWNYQVKGVPKYDGENTRSWFLLNRAKWLAIHMLVIDAICVYCENYYYRPGVDVTKLTGRSDNWGRSIFNSVHGFSGIYSNISMIYTQIAMLCVLVGLGQPKDWPTVFDSWSNATTLRKFWNTYWHQIMRRPLTRISQDVCHVLNIKRGTWLSSYTQLYVCMFVSGVGHAISSYTLPYGPNHTLYDRFMYYFQFMFFQAFAVHIEDFVIWCYDQITETDAPAASAGTNGHASHGANKMSNGHTVEGTGQGKLDKIEKRKYRTTWHGYVGYIWVICFWYFICGYALPAYLRSGQGMINPLPFSVVTPLVDVVETMKPGFKAWAFRWDNSIK